jgi:hypothetical protein
VYSSVLIHALKINKIKMSSSSDSEDENLKKFAEAVDNSFYKPEEKKEEKKLETLKSQRYLDEEENVFHSELNVSETMKNFIGKKMSSLIEKEVEFVTVKEQKINCETKDRVKLLKGCKQALKLEDPVDDTVREKVEIKRRKVDGNEDKIKESKKLSLASTDITKIQQEISLYDKKVKHKPFSFKSASDGKCYLQEPPNEFTAARKKNNWDESKIKSTKNYGKSLNKIL